MIVYDIPYRTGSGIDRQTLLELALHPHIQAIKDCGGDAAKTLAVIAQGRLQVLAGDDLQIFSTVAQGGVGAIAASAHIGTAHFVRLLELLKQGDIDVAILALPFNDSGFVIQPLYEEPFVVAVPKAHRWAKR